MMVSKGSTTAVAIRRGVTSFWIGIRAQGAHGVDLLGDAHGAQFAGDAAGVAPGDQQRRQHRPQFAHQRDGDDLSDLPLRAVGRERARHLQGHHRRR